MSLLASMKKLFCNRRLLFHTFVLLVVLNPAANGENENRSWFNHQVPISPPICGPPYLNPDVDVWNYFLQAFSSEFISQGAYRMDDHPVTYARKRSAPARREQYLFWGVLKCYPTEMYMETSEECLDCLMDIREMLFHNTCGNPFYTPQSGSYQSDFCYFRFTTTEIFREDQCPYVPEPYDHN